MVSVALELLEGLRAVHERGLVHCDVKPANVMLGAGPAKLIDFGIATAARAALEGDTSIGSLHFMSPEQLRGEALEPASDLFSLGALMYAALTGRPPYPGSNPQEVSQAHDRSAVPPPSSLSAGVSPRLDAVVLQALRRDASARFHTARAMTVALSAAARSAPVESDPDDDETRVIATGYVPPAVPAPPPQPSRRKPSPAVRHLRRAPNLMPLLGTILVLGAVALVIVLVVVPLLQIGSRPPVGSPSAAPTVVPTAGNVVTVPNVVGLSAADAIDTADEAGLEWTVRCAEDQSQPEGIVDQEPPANSEVRRGSPFTMYSARISDCR